jgi:hypothetical protein
MVESRQVGINRVVEGSSPSSGAILNLFNGNGFLQGVRPLSLKLSVTGEPVLDSPETCLYLTDC